MRFLTFVSLALCLLAGCSPKLASVSGGKYDIPFWTPQLRDNVQTNRYRIAIVKDELNISGIWMVKRMDETWRGAMINEFGLKIFDFTCTANRCKIIHPVAMMDKWYIKKTIADDVQFMLEADNPAYKTGRTARRSLDNNTLTITNKNRMLQRLPSGEMAMYNKKRNLTYTLNKMED